MKAKVKDLIIKLLIERAPNPVSNTIIENRLNDLETNEVENALDELQKEGRIENPMQMSGEGPYAANYYKLKSYNGIPIRRTIKIGDIEVNRILRVDSVESSLEDINEAVERLAEYSDSLEDIFYEKFKKEMNRYWANIIILFGLFIAIFSLIIVALPRINMPENMSFFNILLTNTAQILPITLVLAIFIWIVAKLFR